MPTIREVRGIAAVEWSPGHLTQGFKTWWSGLTSVQKDDVLWYGTSPRAFFARSAKFREYLHEIGDA